MAAVNFPTAFKFPFNNARRMWNILWVLLPIFGWFALFGYQINIINGFVKGNFKGLPKMEFSKNMKLGFWMFLKGLPFILALIFVSILLSAADQTLGSIGGFFIALFIVPVLTINFYQKQTVDSYFELSIVKHVFNNFQDYLIALLKSLGLAAVFIVMILILVGIPASAFTKNLFLADFYGRRVKKGK